MFRVLLLILAVVSLLGNAIAGDDFFPVGNDRDYAQIDRFRADWYEKQLLAMHESSLFASNAASPVYRFTWLRTFHHPMVFRLSVNQDGTGVLVAKMADGAGGYEPGKLAKDIAIAISPLDIQEFVKKFEDTKFWHMPTRVEGFGMDGAQWIWEARKDGLYKIVDRWSDSDSDLGKLALDLMIKSKLELDEIY